MELYALEIDKKGRDSERERAEKLSAFDYVSAYAQELRSASSNPVSGAGKSAGQIASSMVFGTGVIEAGANLIGSGASVGLAGAGAMMLLGALGDDSDFYRSQHEYELGRFAKPMLSVSVPAERTQDPVAGVRKVFLTAAAWLESSGAQCDPAAFVSPGGFSRNTITQFIGSSHARVYQCPGARTMVSAYRISEKHPLGSVANGAVTARIDFTYVPGQPRDAGRKLYEQLRASMPADWVAVYTADDPAGQWKVFVANQQQTLAFAAPASSLARN